MRRLANTFQARYPMSAYETRDFYAAVQNAYTFLYRLQAELTLENIKSQVWNAAGRGKRPEWLDKVSVIEIETEVTKLESDTKFMASLRNMKRLYPRQSERFPDLYVDPNSHAADTTNTLPSYNVDMTPLQFSTFARAMIKQHNELQRSKKPINYDSMIRPLVAISELEWLDRVPKYQVEDVIKTLNESRVLSNRDSYKKPFSVDPGFDLASDQFDKLVSCIIDQDYNIGLDSRKLPGAVQMLNRLKKGVGSWRGYPQWFERLRPSQVQEGINQAVVENQTKNAQRFSYW